MKKLLLIIFGTFLFLGTSFAQLNPGLESWSGTSPDFSPDNWATNNEFITVLE